MRAVGYQSPGGPEVLTDVIIDDPVPGAHDILVAVDAISVNPVDFKVRSRPSGAGMKVLGWDAVGVVREVGDAVSLFVPGDRVWYSGTINRPGCDSELHVVDERIAALAPSSLDDADAAAMPLTAVTAWELLFDRLAVPRASESESAQSLLVVGGAGGVGSILIQLARQLTDLTVIGTASRPETAEWVESMGAHHVVDHNALVRGLNDLGFQSVDLIAALTQTDLHLRSYVDLIVPQGKIGLIDDPVNFDISLLKQKSVSVHWELMFTRSLFQTPDMIAQHKILTEVGGLVDRGVLHSTRRRNLGDICAKNLRTAHELQQSGQTIGKTVLVGWPPVDPGA